MLPGSSVDVLKNASFYSITKAGRKRLTHQKASWARTMAVMRRMLGEEL